MSNTETTVSSELMFPVPDVPATPPASIRYRRAMRVGTALVLLARARNIIWGLMVRQIRSQYSQQVLGLAWVLIAPIAQMVVFNFVLGRAGTKAAINFHGIPKPLFLFVALVAWSLFAGGVATGATSLIGNPLLNKIYAPREVFPIAQVGTSIINAIASAVILPVLFLLYSRGPSITAFWSIVPMILLTLFTLAVALIMSAITVYARDLRSGLPLLLQLGMFMPGVLYPVVPAVPLGARGIYAAILPAGPLIDQIRQTFFLHQAPSGSIMLICGLSTLVWLAAGFMFFKRLETGFADVS